MERTCTIEGCDRPYRASGYCQRHYAKWRNHGDPLHTRREPPPKPLVLCKVEGCDRHVEARGMCRMHYKRAWKRDGAVAARAGDRGDIVERLDAQSHGVPGGCIEWTSRPNSPKGGYGRIRFGPPDPDTGRRKYHLAHRVAWMLWNDVDDIPPGVVIRHQCNNDRCINPLHLIDGTHSDNSRDAVRAGRHPSRKLSRAMQARLRAVALRHGVPAATIDRIVAELT